MFQEFKRYGLSDFRKLIGILQLLGATGLLMGFFYPISTLLASAGLVLLMLLGFLVRIKIKDGLLVSMLSFALMLLNLYILLHPAKIFNNLKSFFTNAQRCER